MVEARSALECALTLSKLAGWAGGRSKEQGLTKTLHQPEARQLRQVPDSESGDKSPAFQEERCS